MCFSSTSFSLQAGGTGQKAITCITICFSSTSFSLHAGGDGQAAITCITMCFSSTSFSLQAGGDGLSGLEENGSRSRRCRRPVGAAVVARVSDERSEESARQDERQPASRSPRPAARLVITGMGSMFFDHVQATLPVTAGQDAMSFRPRCSISSNSQGAMVDRAMHSLDVPDAEPDQQSVARRERMPRRVTRADTGRLAIFGFALTQYEMNEIGQRNT